jgi:hypothetical protein
MTPTSDAIDLTVDVPEPSEEEQIRMRPGWYVVSDPVTGATTFDHGAYDHYARMTATIEAELPRQCEKQRAMLKRKRDEKAAAESLSPPTPTPRTLPRTSKSDTSVLALALDAGAMVTSVVNDSGGFDTEIDTFGGEDTITNEVHVALLSAELDATVEKLKESKRVAEDEVTILRHELHELEAKSAETEELMTTVTARSTKLAKLNAELRLENKDVKARIDELAKTKKAKLLELSQLEKYAKYLEKGGGCVAARPLKLYFQWYATDSALALERGAILDHRFGWIVPTGKLVRPFVQWLA